MESAKETHKAATTRTSPIFADHAFSRLDESEDSVFYSRDRFVSHLDALALETIEKLISELIVEKNAVILDLMAGWDSHIPKKTIPKKVVGLGLNKNELAQNEALSEALIHDLNKEPSLPFEDQTFDVVINTVSVDYMTDPIGIFREVGRVLKPGGLFLVIFSNRMFPQKAVKVWRESSEDERVLLVEEFFKVAGAFETATVFVSKGKPRPEGDKYAQLGIPSDPVYAVYADRKGHGSLRKSMPFVSVSYGEEVEKEVLDERKRAVKGTLCCPYCGEKMRKWAVPDNPFAQTWDNDFMYICFNDACSYFVKGWDFMYRDGNRGVSYRLMYNPEKDRCMPIPVPTRQALKEGIVD